MKPYLMSNFPSVRPSLNLQFDSQPTPADMTSHLASVGATFSRASIGTYTDANGLIQEATSGQARPNYSTAGVHEGLLIEESRTNINKASEDFSTNNYILTDATIEVNKGIAPDGTASADAWVSPSGSFSPSIRQEFVLSSGATYTFSVFAKANGYSFLRINAFFGSSDSSWFNLSTGELGTIGATSTAKIEDYGNGWYRCSITRTQSGASTKASYIAGTPTDNTVAYTGDGESGILIWGAQMEAGSFPTSYIPTIPTFTSRASDGTYFDSSGVLQTASTDVARIDHKYIDGEWVEAGLLLEGASTNLLPYSEDLTQFTNNNNTVNNTTKAVTGNGVGASTISQNSSYTSGNSYVISTDVEYVNHQFIQITFVTTATGGSLFNYANFDIVNGTVTATGANLDGAEIKEIGTNKYKLVVKFTAVASTSTSGIIIIAVDSGTAIRAASNTLTTTYKLLRSQIEEGSQATSYIATSGSTATRSADVYTTATKERSDDVCYIDGTAFTDFYNQEEGTWFANLFASGNTGTILDADSTSVDRFPQLYIASSTSIQSSFVSFNTYTVDTISAGDELTISVTVTDGAQRNFYNGEFKEETTVANPKDLDTLYIGDRDVGSTSLNGSIKKLIYFPRALSDNELIKLTQ